MNSEFRIKKNTEFSDVIGKKQLLKTKNFNIYYKQNTFNHLRFGLSVGKKIGNAVIRNKVKRQLRSFITLNLKLQKISYDIVVIVKPDFLKNKFQENLSLFDRTIKTLYERQK